MSCIATFYLLLESQHTEFIAAHRDEKKVTYKSTLFGKKEIVTGEKYLWEYLDDAAKTKEDLPYSGFVLVDYLFVFTTFPEDLDAELTAVEIDEHYTVFSADLASRLAEYFKANPPADKALTTFAAEERPGENATEYAEALREVHGLFLAWMQRVNPGEFGVLHLSF